MTYFNTKEKLINKVGKIDVIGGDNAKIADKVIYKSIYNIISWSRSGIQSIHSEFKLIKFNNGKKW